MASPASFAQRVELAQETRKRFVTEAGQALVALAAALQERLTALMNEAAPARDMQSRREIWTSYQRKRAAWLDGTQQAWLAALKPVTAPGKRPDGGLELLGTEQVEHQILASRLAQGVLEKVEAELNDLRLRLKYLHGQDELEGYDILQPEVLLRAIVEQWDQAGLASEAWPLLSETIQTLLAQRLQAAYANGNQFLIKRGVLPTIELKDHFKRVSSAAPAALRREPGATPIAEPALAGRPGSRLGSAAEETRMLTSGTPLARARSRALGVMGQLKQLLKGAVGTNFEAAGYPQPAPSPALAAALTEHSRLLAVEADRGTLVEDYSAAGVVRVAGELRQQTAELKDKAETKGEKATIEIVALMFQAILQEERIPPAIRVWFARLQMPVLRLALAEPDFFGTLNHPARQLIDRMGSCVMGFDASGIHGSALETEVKRVVQVIEQYPETGRRVYQLVYDEFQRFLAQSLMDSPATQKMASMAQQVEQKETLTIQYTIEMRDMLKDMPVRDEIRDFLFKVWAEVLALAAVRKGPQHVETLALKKSASDLVWAASAKPSRADRARVIKDLPQLVHQLRAGMNLLGVAPEAQEVYIKTVSDTLADAFLSKTQAIAAEQIQAMAERLEKLEDFVSDDGVGDLPLDAQSIETMLGLDASLIDVVAKGGSQPGAAMLAWAQELQVGDWFTLDHNARVAQVQFVWRSRGKHLHLFASTDGRSYLIQAGRLAAYLQAGLLVPQEEEALTVRATRDALGKLEANPERLLH